jgi:hypothetical protein
METGLRPGLLFLTASTALESRIGSMIPDKSTSARRASGVGFQAM